MPASERCSEFSMRRRTDHELAWRWKRDAWRYNCRLSVLLGGPAGIRNTQEAVCRTDGGVSVMHAVFFFLYSAKCGPEFLIRDLRKGNLEMNAKREGI